MKGTEIQVEIMILNYTYLVFVIVYFVVQM